METLAGSIAELLASVCVLVIPFLIKNFKKILNDFCDDRDSELNKLREEVAEIRQEQILATRYRLCQMLNKLEMKIKDGIQPNLSFIITLTEQYKAYIAQGGNGDLKTQYDNLIEKTQRGEE